MKNIITYEKYKLTFKEFLNKWCESSLLMTVLECSGYGLIDLNGIEQFTNLKHLKFNFNQITSLENIKNLTKLKTLYCENNYYIKSLTSISNLTKLEYISCGLNQITSLNGIENLSELKTLVVNNNELTSLKGIENLTKLDSLFCGINPINWVDYIDKQGRTYYTKLPKSIITLRSDKFKSMFEYQEFMDKNQPSGISRKFNF